MKKLFAVLAAVLLLAIMACSGGGDGDGGGKSNGSSSGATTNTAPQIISAPEIFAKADNAYIYKVNAIDNQSDSLSYSLTKAPKGMEINPGTGTVSWFPNASQGGKHDVTVQVSDGNEQATQSFTVAVETSKNLASKFISASIGGQVNATDSAGLISDVQITIPPGVLATDATMFVNKLSNPSYLPDNVPAFEVVAGTSISKAQSAKVMKFKSSAATLPRPIIITVKYSDDISIPFIDETQIEVCTDVSDGGRLTPAEIVSRDIIQNIIIAKVYRPFGIIAVGSGWSFAEEQARNFIPYKGSEEKFWKNQGKNLLILHGIFSSSKSFMGTDDFAEYFYNDYDNILFYNYPSSRPIEDNAMALFGEISYYPNVKFDIIAHSMGGLVSRYLIEKRGSRNVDHLFMIGTPNFGSRRDLLRSYLQDAFGIKSLLILPEGLEQLARKSQFLLDLNLNVGPEEFASQEVSTILIERRGQAKYFLFTGDIGNGTDGQVDVPSPMLKSLLSLDDNHAKNFGPDNSYEHSKLHENCATNGICAEIKKGLTLPSGTLSILPTSCVIAAGASSCSVSLTWSTTNPVGTSAVTSKYPIEGTHVADGNFGTTTASIPYGGRSFYLYNNEQLLATRSATATCAAGSTWNDSICAAANTPSNTSPVIYSLVASSSNIMQNESTNLTCDAGDPDGDSLTYSWTRTGGNIVGSGSTVTWTAPATAGTYAVTCSVSDGKGGTSSKGVNINVTAAAAAPMVSTATPNKLTQGTGTQNVTIAGSYFTAQSYHSFSTDNQSTWYLPEIAPTYNNSNSMTVQVNTSNLTVGTIVYIKVCSSKGSSTCSGSVPVTIQAPATTALSITTTALPSATVGTGYAQGVEKSGGQTPYTWSVSSGLPSGLNINSSTGAIYGTPNASGTFSFTVTVRDSSSPQQTYSKMLSMTVASAAPVEIIVDDQGSGFTKYRYNPATAMPEAWIGYNGHMYYVNNTQNGAYDYAIWTPSLSGGSGTYAVYVYVPNNYANTTNAVYSIYHNGTLNVYVINQSANPNSWALLGSYYFAASGGEYVKLTDYTGETSSSKYVAFDAIKWVKQ